METIQHLLQYIIHIDDFLFAFVASYGTLTYFVLFLIIFCETGLVITPFLPGDSLLFVAGSIAANPGSALDIQLLFIVLLIASILGNKTNYLIGRMIGPKIFSAQASTSALKNCLFNRKHLLETHRFYEKHGGKTIIIARFLPIIRTFAPFVAGIGYMSMRRFTTYNILSGLLWIGSLLAAGYFFGALPIIKNNFSFVIYGIIAASILPPAIAIIYKKART